MTADRVIAQVCSRDGYAGLMDAMRLRMVELDTTYDGVDELAGLPLRYTSKLFAPVPIKGVGRHSLGPLLGALGIKLLVVVDTALMAKVTKQLSHREPIKRADAHGGTPTRRRRKKSALKGNSDWGRVMAARRFLLSNPKQRSAKARKAARAQWRKVKARPATRAPGSRPGA